MTAKAPQPMPEGVDRTNRPKAPSTPPNKPHSGCVCDCVKNYGKGCLNPKAYLNGGCK